VGTLVLVATLPVAHLLFVGVEEPVRRRLRVLGSVPRRAGSAKPALHVATEPAAEVPVAGAVPGQGRPVGNDEARRDPETQVIRVVRRPDAKQPVRDEEARRDPETRGIPVARPSTGPVPVVPGQQRSEVPARVPAAASAVSRDDAPTGEPDVAAGAVGRAILARRAGIEPRTKLAADLVTASAAGATRTRPGKHRPGPGRGNRGWIDSPQFGARPTP
jgi:hypothetical protein